MKRLVAVISILLFLLNFPFFAVADETQELLGEEITEELFDSTPDYAKELAEKLGISEITPEALLSLEPTAIVSLIIEYIRDSIAQPLKISGVVIAIVVFCAVADVFKPTLNKTADVIFSTVSSLSISAVLVSSAVEGIRRVCDAMAGFSDFMIGYVPVFASAVTVSGQAVSGGVYSGFMLLVCQMISGVSSNILLPLLSMYLAVSIVAGMSPELRINTVAEAFKTCVTKTLGLSLTVFVGMMSLQTLVATGSDNMAVKTGKYLIGNFVPVVGSAISEVFLSVQGYIRLMKTCIGWYGVVAAVLIFLPVLLQTVVWRLAIYLAQLISHTLDVSSVSTALNAVGSVFTMLIAFVLTFALLLIVTTTIMLVIGIG